MKMMSLLIRKTLTTLMFILPFEGLTLLPFEEITFSPTQKRRTAATAFADNLPPRCYRPDAGLEALALRRGATLHEDRLDGCMDSPPPARFDWRYVQFELGKTIFEAPTLIEDARVSQTNPTPTATCWAIAAVSSFADRYRIAVLKKLLESGKLLRQHENTTFFPALWNVASSLSAQLLLNFDSSWASVSAPSPRHNADSTADQLLVPSSSSSATTSSEPQSNSNSQGGDPLYAFQFFTRFGVTDDGCAHWEGGVELNWGAGCCGKDSTAVEEAKADFAANVLQESEDLLRSKETERATTTSRCSADVGADSASGVAASSHGATATSATTTAAAPVDAAKCQAGQKIDSYRKQEDGAPHPVHLHEEQRENRTENENMAFAMHRHFCRACDFNGTCAWSTELAESRPANLNTGAVEAEHHEDHGPPYLLYRADRYGTLLQRLPRSSSTLDSFRTGAALISVNAREVEALMRREIYEHGPIVCGVRIRNSAAFQNYKFGNFFDGAVGRAKNSASAGANDWRSAMAAGLILRDEGSTHRMALDTQLDHVVTLVGFGETNTSAAFWSGRNSYGSNWGLRGFFYMERGVNAFLIESGRCSWAVPKADDVKFLAEMGDQRGSASSSPKEDVHEIALRVTAQPDPAFAKLIWNEVDQARGPNVVETNHSLPLLNIALQGPDIDPSYWTEMEKRRLEFKYEHFVAHKKPDSGPGMRSNSSATTTTKTRTTSDVVVPDHFKAFDSFRIYRSSSTSPADLSTTTHTLVTPSKVLSQFAGRICYHCWAAAITAAFADRIRIATRGLLAPTIAMQSFLNWDPTISGGDCRNGMAYAGLKFLKNYAAAEESNAPYRGYGFSWGIECCAKMGGYDSPGALGNRVLFQDEPEEQTEATGEEDWFDKYEDGVLLPAGVALEREEERKNANFIRGGGRSKSYLLRRNTVLEKLRQAVGENRTTFDEERKRIRSKRDFVCKHMSSYSCDWGGDCGFLAHGSHESGYVVPSTDEDGSVEVDDDPAELYFQTGGKSKFGFENPCDGYPNVYRISDFSPLLPVTEFSMMREIYAGGPIACGFFSNTKSVDRYRATKPRVLVPDEHSAKISTEAESDHFVEVTGWGTSATTNGKGTTSSDSEHWVVRNSWGTSWGYAGWFQIQKGSNLLNMESTFCLHMVPSRANLEAQLKRVHRKWKQ